MVSLCCLKSICDTIRTRMQESRIGARRYILSIVAYLEIEEISDGFDFGSLQRIGLYLSEVLARYGVQTLLQMTSHSYELKT